MKYTLLFKSLPMALLVAYSLIKSLPGQKIKKDSGLAAVQTPPSRLSGEVMRVVADEDLYLTQIRSGTSTHWVAIDGERPAPGDCIAFMIARKIDAYECKTQSLAFEQVLIARDLTISSSVIVGQS